MVILELLSIIICTLGEVLSRLTGVLCLCVLGETTHSVCGQPLLTVGATRMQKKMNRKGLKSRHYIIFSVILCTISIVVLDFTSFSCVE